MSKWTFIGNVKQKLFERGLLPKFPHVKAAKVTLDGAPTILKANKVILNGNSKEELLDRVDMSEYHHIDFIEND